MTAAVSDNPWSHLREQTDPPFSVEAEAESYGAGVPSRRSRRKGLWVIGLFIVGMCFGIGVAGGHAYTTLSNGFENSVNRFGSPVFTDDSDADEQGAQGQDHERPEQLSGSHTVLVIGTDGGSGGTVTEETERADAMMLAHVRDGEAEVYSIPRDLWVEVPGYGDYKLSQTYSLGGMPALTSSIEELTDVRIDDVAQVDLAGFAEAVDIIGPVTVELEEGFTAADGTEFVAGENTLDAETAEAFVRERYSFAGSDLVRMSNQQLFAEAVSDELSDASMAQMLPLIDEVGEHVTLSDGLGVNLIARLALAGREAEFSTLEHAGTGFEQGQSVLYPLDDYDLFAG